jgi:hypothetical protein
MRGMERHNADPKNTQHNTTHRKMKTQTQHTPAPWDIFPKNDTLEIGNYGANAPLVRLSATVPTNDWEGWANANLIASAPNLLLALETLLSDRSCPSFLTLEEWRNTHLEFRETLRKAKGEA